MDSVYQDFSVLTADLAPQSKMLSMRQLLLRHILRSETGSQCKHCTKGTFGVNSESAVWKNHIKVKHPEVWQQIQEELADQAQPAASADSSSITDVDHSNQMRGKNSISSGSSSSSSSVASARPKQSQQPSIVGFTIKSNDQLALLAQLCVTQGIAHRVVDTPEFRQFMSALGWSAKLPSRDVLRSVILEQAASLRATVVAALQNTPLTLASDGWTNVNQDKVTNIVLIAHGVAYYWCSIVNTHEANSAEWLCDRLQSVFSNLIHQHRLRIAGLVMDNEAVNRKCHRLLTAHFPFLVQIPCAAHTIQLVVQSSLRHSTFAPIIEQLRAVLQFFEAKQHRNKLKEIQSLRGEKPLRILRPCATRWSSTLTSVERLIKLRDHIELCITPALLPDRHAFFDGLQQLKEFLTPFRTATDAVQRDDATLLSVYQHFTALLAHVHSVRAEWAAVDLLKRWKKYVNVGATMATALFSFQSLPASIPSRTAHDFILDFGVQYLQYYTECASTTLRDQLLAELALFVGREGLFRDIETKKASLLRTGQSVRTVWHLYSETLLAQVALVLLSVGASEAAVERTFSTQSLVHTKLRNRLLPPIVEAEMFIRFNRNSLSKSTATTVGAAADQEDSGLEDSDVETTDWFDENRYSVEEIDASTDEEPQDEEKEECEVQAMVCGDDVAPVEPEARAAAAAAASSRRAVRRAISVPFATTSDFVQWYIKDRNITSAYNWNADARNALQSAASSRCKRGPTTIELEKQIKEAVARACNS